MNTPQPKLHFVHDLIHANYFLNIRFSLSWVRRSLAKNGRVARRSACLQNYFSVKIILQHCTYYNLYIAHLQILCLGHDMGSPIECRIGDFPSHPIQWCSPYFWMFRTTSVNLSTSTQHMLFNTWHQNVSNIRGMRLMTATMVSTDLNKIIYIRHQ